MKRIVVLDDHALFRVGLIGLLKLQSEFEIVGEFRSFSNLKPLIPHSNIDLVLVDISLGEESGLDVAQYIKHVNPDIKVIILSSHKEEFYVINALEASVDGYIHKDAEPEELIKGIKKVLNGEKFFSLEISSLLINNIYTKGKNSIPTLTNKEREIAKYLMEGFSSKEIADKLDISPRTVESHRSNILEKFNLKNTTEFIKKIVEQKIRF